MGGWLAMPLVSLERALSNASLLNNVKRCSKQMVADVGPQGELQDTTDRLMHCGYIDLEMRIVLC